MSKLPCCMNINALNEDNLCFIRKVLEQVPSLKSHSVDFLLYESRHNAIFPLKSTFPTWSRFFFPFFTDRRKEGGKISLCFEIKHLKVSFNTLISAEREEKRRGGGGGGGDLPYLYRSHTRLHRSQPCSCHAAPGCCRAHWLLGHRGTAGMDGMWFRHHAPDWDESFSLRISDFCSLLTEDGLKGRVMGKGVMGAGRG